MRITRLGAVLREVQVEIPADLHARLQSEIGRRKISRQQLLLDWLLPFLNSLPEAPPRYHPRIEA